MEQISIAFTLDQIDTLILACGVAANNSTIETSRRFREVMGDLIHAKVLVTCADYVKEDERATSELLCAKLHSGAEYGKVVD